MSNISKLEQEILDEIERHRADLADLNRDLLLLEGLSKDDKLTLTISNDKSGRKYKEFQFTDDDTARTLIKQRLERVKIGIFIRNANIEMALTRIANLRIMGIIS